MQKTNLLGLTRSELEEVMASIKEKPYRGRQLYKWLYNTRLHDFSLMTDLSKELRGRLAEQFEIRGLEPAERQVSEDGTEKFLFRLEDGKPVETVLIPTEEHGTVCVSSQAGCALGCRFCATGTMGLLRNLAVGEIVGQLVYLKELYGNASFTNVVFMGMGEPLHNYDNVIEAVRIMTDTLALGLSAKRVTISTSGISPKIRKLADSGLKAKLAVSLHAATQDKRVQIMPMAETFKLDRLREAIKYWTDTTGMRVTFEYILFEGLNDTMEDVKALARFVQGIPCKINILAYNPVPGLAYKRPNDEKVDWFGRELYPRAPAVTVRKSRGRDIDAACGQLAGRSST
jgi:23S rRNA (adenine2503-C2)-methyltransferase